MAVMLVADALATIPLRANGAYPNLVGEAGGGTTRDEPTTAALVGGQNLLRVELEEAEPSKGVGGNGFRLYTLR